MGKRKEFTGMVTSDKMQKTVIVRILQMGKHPKYSRISRGHIKFKVHDAEGIARLGDIVEIEETRPLSKDKHFRVLQVIKKASSAGIEVKEEIQ